MILKLVSKMKITFISENSYSLGPSMDRIVINICSGSYDGTGDNIRLKFYNDNWQSCETGWINSVKSLNEPGSSVLFSGNKELGDCTTGSFRPDSTLKVAIEVWRAGWNIQYNGEDTVQRLS